MKSQYTAIYQEVLIFWNGFARDHGYATLDTLNSKLREKLKQRLRAERDYLHRMPRYFALIHTHCGGSDEFGKRLGLYDFMRSTTTLRALRAELSI